MAKNITKTEQERIELVGKLNEWVNQNPEDRACVVIASSGDTTTAAVVGAHKVAVEALASALNTEDSALRRIVMESLMVASLSKMSE